MKQVLKAMEARGASDDEKKAFQAGAATAVKKITGAFKDWEFYTGESGGLLDDGTQAMYVSCSAVQGMMEYIQTARLTISRTVLLNYREDGITPYMVFWRHGLKEEKV